MKKWPTSGATRTRGESGMEKRCMAGSTRKVRGSRLTRVEETHPGRGPCAPNARVHGDRWGPHGRAACKG
ncbi:hypothetical protein TIFTF001_027258 [Ficus carica]|uniref:Uncharacterized protein n=1 Tax=Ficus carica TaxID=3494 RepID=A0AA88IUV2_FICCA|nr:hypothetical protein TIFTF001_027258 [Ficus carica]